MKQLIQLLIVALPFISYAQTVNVNEYNPYIEQDGVLIQVGEGEYIDDTNNTSHTRYFFRYLNNTNEDVIISFNKELYYGNQCLGCGSNNEEQTFSVKVKANSMRALDSNYYDKTFSIFIKDNNGWIKKQLTDFKLTNIQISKIK